MFDAKSLLNMVMGAGQQGGQQGGAAGGIGGLLGSVLAQATQGLKQGGQDLNTASGGMGDKLKGMASQAAGGRSPQDLMQQAKEMIARNPGMAAAAAAGLGGLLLGTKSGRGLAMGAAQAGGLALIGGLAYSAYQNYQNGKPLISRSGEVHTAPHGSGFADDDGDDQNRALLMLRAMIAAAAADGEIDNAERARIFGNLRQAGLEDEAAAYIEAEFRKPLDAAGLARLSDGPETAAQIYTAARLAIDPDTGEEKVFLAALAAALRLDPELATQIDAAVASVMESQPV